MIINRFTKKILKYKIFDIDPYKLRGSTFHGDLIKKRNKIYKNLKKYLTSVNSTTCLLCNKKLMNKNLYFSWKKYKLINCDNCGSTNTNINFKIFKPQFSHNNIEKINFVQKYIKKNFIYRAEKFGKERIEYILSKIKFKNKKIKVLDFACGYGSFLYALKNKKIDGKGLDFDDISVNFAKKMNLLVSKNDLSDENDNTYDLITFFDVIEHLLEPNKIIKTAIKKLKKGGHLLFFTPNLNSLSTILMGSNHNMFSPFDHVCFYNEKSFNFIKKKHNLDLISYEYFGLDIKDYLQMLEAKNKNIKFNKIMRNFSNITQSFIDNAKASNSIRIIFKKK